MVETTIQERSDTLAETTIQERSKTVVETTIQERSEALAETNIQCSNFQLYHGENDDDEVRFVLDQHAELDFYSSSSLKQSTGRHAVPLGHIILIPSQPVFVLSP